MAHRGRGYDDGYHRDSRRSDRESKYSDYAPRWSWACTIVSIVSMTLFASWFGIIGLLFAGLSYSDHKVGDYKRARYKRWWSWCCSISGMVFTVIAIFMLMMVMFWIDVPKPDFRHATYWIPPWLYDELENATITTTTTTTPAPASG